MTKKVVVRDERGVVVHIGAWDERVETVEVSQLVVDASGRAVLENGKPKLLDSKVYIPRNPMPAGYKECTAKCVRDDDGGWHAVENFGPTRRAHYPSPGDQLDALWKGFTAQAERIASLEGQVAELRDVQPKRKGKGKLIDPPPLRADLARDLTEAEAMCARVGAIKARFPKPEKP